MNHQTYLDTAIAACREAGQIALDKQNSLRHIQFKGEKDIVTEADLACDAAIRKHLSDAFPDHNIVTEEGADKEAGSDFTWYVDPIDGTINYSRCIPLWAISIGLIIKGVRSVGAIYMPAMDEMYTAIKGQGAFCNGKKISVSHLSTLNQAIISHGDLNVGDITLRHQLNEENLKRRMLSAEAMQRVKCLGSSCVEASYVASGKLDAYCMVCFYPWDVAVGSLLVEEAGGKVCQLDGSAWDIHSKSVLFSNQELHQGMLKALSYAA